MQYLPKRITLILYLISALCLSIIPSAGRAEPVTADYQKDLQAFINFLDQEYTFFELKGIKEDWQRGTKDLLQRAEACESDEDFLLILYDAFRILRDGHLGIRETQVAHPTRPPEYFPGISFLPATNERVIIMYPPAALADSLRTGMIVTQIDGVDARKYLEDRAAAAWKAGGFFSSPQRARLFEYRIPFRGKPGEKHILTIEDPDGIGMSVQLENNVVARGWPHTYNLPSNLKRVGRSFHFTKLADEVGYMYLRRVDDSIPKGIDEATIMYANAKGWIVDLRGNSGGGYDAGLLERIDKLPRPIVVLIDAGCASAGETLARDFRRRTGAQVIGTPSAGSSSSKRTFAFPSGIATLTVPVRSRWRADGKPIEFNGIAPEVIFEAVPEEVAAGQNSGILRAQEFIRGQIERRDKEQQPDKPDGPTTRGDGN